MQEVAVSIIIVSYNCSDLINECINSCIKEPECEVIVVDNHSTDGTVNKLIKFGSKVTLISNIDNKGYTKACNQGINVANGRYVFLLNPDAYILSGAIGKLIEVLDSNHNIGAVAPLLIFPDGRLQNYTRRFPTVGGLAVESFIPRRLWKFFMSYSHYTYADLDLSRFQKVDQPAGAALMYRRKYKLDDTYFIYGSDLDLCKQIYNSGKEIFHVPQAKVVHYQSKGGTSTENHKLRVFLDLDNYYGMQYFFKKFNELGRLNLYRVIFFILLFLRSSVSIFLGRNKARLNWIRFYGFLSRWNFRDYHGN